MSGRPIKRTLRDGGALGTVRWFVESHYWTLRL